MNRSNCQKLVDFIIYIVQFGDMELWNTRKLQAPPTYTYEEKKAGSIDIDHFRILLQDGIKFYNEQYFMKLETTLLSRVTYRMKAKFRNSKDFQTLEKVKKCVMIFSQMDVSKKLEHLLSVLPTTNDDQVFLPTKNMVDFILVLLQGVGKILDRTIEMCKLTAEYYECRFRLGHFWKIALVAIGLVSRIHILSLNIVKFTCLFYVRLLPYSHKLKNSGTEWLPKDYVLPKDLKEWLNIEWSKFDEVIEIPDKEFDTPFFNLVEDSDDDDVEFCDEYIEVDEDEDLEIVEEFKKVNRKKIKPIDLDDSVIILRGFDSDNVDTGYVLSEESTEDDDVELNTKANNVIEDGIEELNKQNKKNNINFGRSVLPVDDSDDIDIGEVISSDDSNEDDSESITENDIGEIEIIEEAENLNKGKNKVGSNRNIKRSKTIDSDDSEVMYIEKVESSDKSEEENTDCTFLSLNVPKKKRKFSKK
ncbi:hypothetical protein HHI36_008876 [Cryptolaemus montrouzieri]|uniref:Nucleolus and neural progenitor protein-like N-terminal domain-containing protein n=1 Tax=Cryptolaemus montrouzieri TaxID=559131 RepID=A0ABD2MTU2_9CUCU